MVPDSVDEMFPLVLVYCPAVFPRTLTEKLHEEFAASVAPLMLIVEEPAVALMV